MKTVQPVRNAMTIDVEDYFQVSAFAPHIARDSWADRECRVEANVDRILGILDLSLIHISEPTRPY